MVRPRPASLRRTRGAVGGGLALAGASGPRAGVRTGLEQGDLGLHGLGRKVRCSGRGPRGQQAGREQLGSRVRAERRAGWHLWEAPGSLLDLDSSLPRAPPWADKPGHQIPPRIHRRGASLGIRTKASFLCHSALHSQPRVCRSIACSRVEVRVCDLRLAWRPRRRKPLERAVPVPGRLGC